MPLYGIADKKNWRIKKEIQKSILEILFQFLIMAQTLVFYFIRESNG